MGISIKTGYKACPECFGRGWNYSRTSTAGSDLCTMCWGSGAFPDYSEITLDMPSFEKPQHELIDDLRAKIAELEARVEAWERVAERNEWKAHDTSQCGECGRALRIGDRVYLSRAGSKEYVCQECVKSEVDE